MGAGGQTQQEFEEWLAWAQQQAPTQAYHGQQYGGGPTSLGRYDADTGTFFPTPISTEYRCAGFVRYKYDDNTYDSRYGMITVSFTDTNPVSVYFPQAAQNDILPDWTKLGFQSEISNGKIAYTNPTDHPQAATLVTAVCAPEKVQGEGWTVQDEGWTDQNCDVETSTDSTGRRVALLKIKLPADAHTVSKNVLIIWKHTSGQVEYQRLSLSVVHGNLKPWPEYRSEMTPFAVGDFKVRVVGGIDGLSFRQDGVKLHLAIDSEKLIEQAARGDKNVTAGRLEIQLKVPEGAKYYQGGNTVFGGPLYLVPDEIAQCYPTIESGWTLEEKVPVAQPWITLSQSYVLSETFQRPFGGSMQYYFAANYGLTNPLWAAVQTIRWLDASGDLLGINYLIYTYDDVSFVTSERVREHENELPANPKDPHAVIGGDWGKQHGDLRLHAKRMPSSPNSYYYELHLEAEDGTNVPIPTGETCDVYLPYPTGYNQQTAQSLSLTIGHYNSQMQLVEDVFSVENGNLELTPYGLHLSVTSFSPYVVSWSINEPASATPSIPAVSVPQTGDSFPLSIVCICALLSLAAIGYFSRKAMRS